MIERKIMTWSDISVGQYQELQNIQTDNEISKFIQMISVCLDCDPDEIRMMPLSEWQTMKSDFFFLTTDPSNVVQHIIQIDGVEYGLEPDMDLISTGVFIDAEQFRQDTIENLHRTLALIYRPITEKKSELEYKIEPHKAEGFERRANLFKEKVSIEIVFGATLFFLIQSMQLSIDMMDYLKDDMTTRLNQAMS